MRFKVYLRVVGPEEAILSFGSEANWSQSSTRPLRRRAVWPPSADAVDVEISWQWQTPWVEASPDTVEESIARFVVAARPLARHVQKHRSALEWASLVVVAECADSELPSGLYFSVDTISSIQELGVDLDIDFAGVNADVTSS